MKTFFVVSPRPLPSLIIIIALHAAVIFLLFAAYGCASAGTRHKDAYALDVWTEPATVRQPNNVHTQPVDVQAAGSTHIRERRTTTATPPATASQRAGLIVGTGLGVGTLAIIALAVLCPGALAGFALRTALKWKSAFSQTVAGIDAAREAGTAKPVTAALAVSQDDTTKRLVHEVRAKG